MSLRSLASLVAVVVLVSACGAGEKSPPKSPGSAEPEPQTLEEAEAQLNTARSALEQGDAPRAPTPSDAPVPAPPPTAGSEPPVPSPTTPGPGTTQADTTSCVTSCRALNSMRRAVSAICRIAGEDTGKCNDALQILQTNEARVRTCGC